jgi:zinc protease
MLPSATAEEALPAPAPWAELLLNLNRDQPETARLTHEATLPFGPTMRVERFVLGNGLQVLVLVDPAAPVVCVQTWFGVGSRHEKEKKTGISHLFEHLMFGATETHPMGVFDRVLEEAGAETNAATFLDWTYYHTNAPKDALPLTLRLEADRMGKLVLNDPELAREKEVVMNERRQRVEDDVEGSVNERLYKEAFRAHGYGWPTIGWMDDIAGFTTDDCRTTRASSSSATSRSASCSASCRRNTATSTPRRSRSRTCTRSPRKSKSAASR